MYIVVQRVKYSQDNTPGKRHGRGIALIWLAPGFSCLSDSSNTLVKDMGEKAMEIPGLFQETWAAHVFFMGLLPTVRQGVRTGITTHSSALHKEVGIQPRIHRHTYRKAFKN